ncbi:NADPH-dependent FMN reductase, partial [Staphylococcus auricularis]|uniref:NADPH-dependent FMN reductase n=1 Tax=Staphylococcus auricularis TaxID=29379 RepID=UPI001246165D
MHPLQQPIHKQHHSHQLTLLHLPHFHLLFTHPPTYIHQQPHTLKLTQPFINPHLIFIPFPLFQPSIPPPLKNLFHLLPLNPLTHKILPILPTAPSPKHYLIPQFQLKPILPYIKAQIIQTYLFIQQQHFPPK